MPAKCAGVFLLFQNGKQKGDISNMDITKLIIKILTALLIVLGTLTGEKTMRIITKERKNGTKRVQIETDPNSKVQQDQKNVVDVNSIISRYIRTGKVLSTTKNPNFGDFTGIGDFHQVQNQIKSAENQFMSLPPNIRKLFGNNVGNLVDFISDPGNREQAIELGLLPQPPVPSPEVGTSANSGATGGVPANSGGTQGQA